MTPSPRPPAPERLSPEAEADAVERARAGDAEAFRVLVDAYRDRAFGLALRIVRSREEAAEVAQDAFVRAWRALPGFRADARFSTWLYRIVMRRAFDAAAVLRRRRGREVALDDGGGVEPGAAPGPDPSAEARGRRLEALIARLPESQRVVVTLFYYEDQTIAEVAATLGVPEGTVKTHLHRARAALRTAWLRSGGWRDDELLRV
jgi:RNA polymerase sigma-70 factor (ECF subfamily)